jgi:hypothetical protein
MIFPYGRQDALLDKMRTIGFATHPWKSGNKGECDSDSYLGEYHNWVMWQTASEQGDLAIIRTLVRDKGTPNIYSIHFSQPKDSALGREFDCTIVPGFEVPN